MVSLTDSLDAVAHRGKKTLADMPSEWEHLYPWSYRALRKILQEKPDDTELASALHRVHHELNQGHGNTVPPQTSPLNEERGLFAFNSQVTHVVFVCFLCMLLLLVVVVCCC